MYITTRFELANQNLYDWAGSILLSQYFRNTFKIFHP